MTAKFFPLFSENVFFREIFLPQNFFTTQFFRESFFSQKIFPLIFFREIFFPQNLFFRKKIFREFFFVKFFSRIILFLRIFLSPNFFRQILTSYIWLVWTEIWNVLWINISIAFHTRKIPVFLGPGGFETYKLTIHICSSKTHMKLFGWSITYKLF